MVETSWSAKDEKDEEGCATVLVKNVCRWSGVTWGSVNIGSLSD